MKVLEREVQSIPHIQEDFRDIIDSDNYTITGYIGRGDWGSVYSALRKVKNRKRPEVVAIKVADPCPAAQWKAEYKKLDLDESIGEEAGRLEQAGCAHVVTSFLEADRNGRPFIVMPKYEQNFFQLLEKVRDPNKKREYFVYETEENPRDPGALFFPHKRKVVERPAPSGLMIDEIIKYARDIVQGIAEIHTVHKRVHCDIKPDNILVDKRGNLRISDLGTSSHTSLIYEGPRDNIGGRYIRSPRLWQGAKEKESDDIYSFGSNLLYLFTGKFALQDEIDEAYKNGERESVQKLMEKFCKVYPEGGEGCSPLEHRKYLTKGKAFDGVPLEFRDLITTCLVDSMHMGVDGEDVERDFERTVKSYQERMIKKSAYDEVKSKLKSKLLKGLAVGTTIAGLGLGLGWLAYFSPKPDYSDKTDIETKISLRPSEQSEVTLESEGDYPFSIIGNVEPDELKDLRKNHIFRYGNKTLVDKIVTVWIDTIEQTGYRDGSLSKTSELVQRDRLLNYTELQAPFLNDVLRNLLSSYSFPTNEIRENTVDLEDSCAQVLVGVQKLRDAQKAANSCDFNKYSTAKNSKGEYVIPETDRMFLESLFHNLEKELPKYVKKKN